MENKIMFVGTGGDVMVLAKQHLNGGGTLFNLQNYKILVDPSVGSIVHLKKLGIDIRTIDVIICTSNDFEYSSDLLNIIISITYNGLDKNSLVLLSKDFENTTIHEKITPLVSRTIIMSPEDKVGLEGLEILALKTSYENKIGLMFSTYNYDVTYSGKTGYFDEMTTLYKDSDILILSMKNTSEIEEKGYLNAQDVKKILTNVKPALSILTHFGIKAFNSNPILLAREIKKSLESNLISAKDGISVNVLDNLLLEKQKTLDEFKKNQIKNG